MYSLSKILSFYSNHRVKGLLKRECVFDTLYFTVSLLSFDRALENRLNFIREGLFINSSVNLLTQDIYHQWYTSKVYNESWIVDMRSHHPLIFIAFGWVQHSDLKSYWLDINPIQSDWRVSMLNMGILLFEDCQRTMVEYYWEGIDGPPPSSVRFGAPFERSHQGKMSFCMILSLY